jgi:hypothetical protein
MGSRFGGRLDHCLDRGRRQGPLKMSVDDCVLGEALLAANQGRSGRVPAGDPSPRVCGSRLEEKKFPVSCVSVVGIGLRLIG